MPVYRPGLERRRGRRDPDHRRPFDPGRGRDRDLALERAADRQPSAPAPAGHPGDDHRRRSARAGPRPAPDLSRHRQLPDGRADGRAPAAAEAGRRHGLPAARQRRGRQHQRPRRGLSRHHRRHDGHRAPERRGRLDRGRRLPGLHQRPDRPRQPADGRRVHRACGPRRLHPGRRLGAVRPAGLCPGHRPGHRQAREQGPGDRRRRHPAAADAGARGGPQPCPDRPAAVRDGLSGARP